MADNPKIERYGTFWPANYHPFLIERDCVRAGGEWTNKHTGKAAGLGLFYHYKAAAQILWPHIMWHRWADLQLKEWLTHRTIVVIGSASTGKTTISGAVCHLLDYYFYPECTTIICCSTTKERLEDRVWGEFKKLHREAREGFEFIPGNLIEGRLRIVTDDRNEESEGRDFRNGIIGVPCQQKTGYTGLGCFAEGTLVDTDSGPRPIESIKVGDAVMTAAGFQRVRNTQIRYANSLISIISPSGDEIRCTPEHPIMTYRGWVNAVDITIADHLMSAHESMQILQKGYAQNWTRLLFGRMQMEGNVKSVPCVQGEVYSKRLAERELFQVLHDEIEDERSCFRGKNSWQEGFGRNGAKGARVLDAERGGSAKEFGEGKEQGWVGSVGIAQKGMDQKASKWREGFQGPRQWIPAVSGREDAYGSVPGSYVRTSDIDQGWGEKLSEQDWVSALLQTGLGLAGHKAGRGGRWGFTFEAEANWQRSKEGNFTAGAGLDNSQILQQSNPERNHEGKVGHRVYNLEVEGHPSFAVHGVICHNSFIGIKNKRLRLIGDELHLLPKVFVDSLANLDKNPDCKVTGLGNPKETMDALGTLAEPSIELGGWDGGVDQTPGTKTWETRRPEGICIQLWGPDSPNLDGKLGIPLITQAAIDRDLAFYGRDSLQFTMMNEGRMPRGQGSRRVLTRDMCQKFGAMGKPLWKGTKITKIGFLDAAFGAVGGDRCIFGELQFGEESAPMTDAALDALVHQQSELPKSRQILALIETILVPIKYGINPLSENAGVGLPEEQIVKFVMEQCATRGISPENFFFDAGMRTSLVTTFARLWSTAVESIDCGGRPSEQMVSAQIRVPWSKYGSKFITEVWFTVRHIVEAGQFRGMTEDVMMEFCSREWGMVGANKVELEPKSKMKDRIGRSPDLADGCAVGCLGATRRGFIISNQEPPRDFRSGPDWRTELKKLARAEWHSGNLQYQ